MRRSGIFALFVFAVLACPARAGADRHPAPCRDCTLDLPRSATPVPLLVVLHGDRESARAAAARWQPAAAERGWALLSLQCPRAARCKDSWWRWNGDPAWIAGQIDKLGALIDPARVYAAGWSGGATYLGMHAPAWPSTFAAVVFHGGGRAPVEDTCPARPLRAYFLVGDRNPLHRLAVALHAYVAGCAEQVVWDLVRGGDHGTERRALDQRKALAILDWLAQHTRASE